MHEKKHILLYFMLNSEASNFEIRGDIFHFEKLSEKTFLRIGFQKTCHIFRFQGINFYMFQVMFSILFV